VIRQDRFTLTSILSLRERQSRSGR
jgi:hypothetical protein